MIPFNRQLSIPDNLELVTKAIKSGRSAGDGPYTAKCEELLSSLLNVPRVLMTTSCTHALEMAGLLLDLRPGDEVIVPSFTFVSTANAFALRGVKVVFCDVRKDTLNLDETHLSELITPATKAVVPVHYAGVGCEMDAINELAAQHGVTMIEDNAHGLFGRYQGKNLGTFGALATQSFHETKNFSCGEGGALLINDESLVERAEIIREKGTNRSRFFRGQVDKYTWVDIGSSYVMSDILAALLYGQLLERDRVQARRRAIWERYYRELRDWAGANDVRLPYIPEHCEQAYHMFYLVMPDLPTRTRFIEHMLSNGVAAVFHYLPLHLSEYGRRWGAKVGDCPVTEDLSDRLVRLPLFYNLAEEERDKIVAAAHDFDF
ncbi:MAG: dTDP-4-amino-4,6-dideoxygalactose transaminase [Alphaproteobacteria bacterium]|nr:MAG: dTDP-4-amino-4,6-dideoxygalactose transaminase [Alphaproteobacteria bacterium]